MVSKGCLILGGMGLMLNHPTSSKYDPSWSISTCLLATPINAFFSATSGSVWESGIPKFDDWSSMIFPKQKCNILRVCLYPLFVDRLMPYLVGFIRYNITSLNSREKTTHYISWWYSYLCFCETRLTPTDEAPSPWEGFPRLIRVNLQARKVSLEIEHKSCHASQSQLWPLMEYGHGMK